MEEKVTICTDLLTLHASSETVNSALCTRVCFTNVLTFYLLLLFFYHFKIPIMGLEVFYEYICNEITLQLYFFASVTSII